MNMNIQAAPSVEAAASESKALTVNEIALRDKATALASPTKRVFARPAYAGEIIPTPFRNDTEITVMFAVDSEGTVTHKLMAYDVDIESPSSFGSTDRFKMLAVKDQQYKFFNAKSATHWGCLWSGISNQSIGIDLGLGGESK